MNRTNCTVEKNRFNNEFNNEPNNELPCYASVDYQTLMVLNASNPAFFQALKQGLVHLTDANIRSEPCQMRRLFYVNERVNELCDELSDVFAQGTWSEEYGAETFDRLFSEQVMLVNGTEASGTEASGPLLGGGQGLVQPLSSELDRAEDMSLERPSRSALISEYGYTQTEISPLYSGCWMRSAWYAIFSHVRTEGEDFKKQFNDQLHLLVGGSRDIVERFTEAQIQPGAFRREEGRFSSRVEGALIQLTESILSQDEAVYSQEYEVPYLAEVAGDRAADHSRRFLSEKRVVDLLKYNLLEGARSGEYGEEYGDDSMIVKLLLHFSVLPYIYSDGPDANSEFSLDIRNFEPDCLPNVIIAHDGHHFEILERRCDQQEARAEPYEFYC